jgi:hypothetical protein
MYASARQLLQDILDYRSTIARFSKTHPAVAKLCADDQTSRYPLGEGDYPTDVVLAQLQKEGALARAKVHAVQVEHSEGLVKVSCATCHSYAKACSECLLVIRMSSLQLWRYCNQKLQGEPKCKRLQKAFEDAKQMQHGVETCRSGPDAERHRLAATDAAIEEQLQAQCAYRSQNNHQQTLGARINQRHHDNAKLCVDLADCSCCAAVARH